MLGLPLQRQLCERLELGELSSVWRRRRRHASNPQDTFGFKSPADFYGLRGLQLIIPRGVADPALFWRLFFFFLRLAESIYGGSFGHVGPGNGYGEWALTTRESGLYRYHWVHMARRTSDVDGCTGWYL